MKKIILIAITILTLGLSTITFAGDEGIKAHGHWTFDIYNADGSFDRKVEFDNALMDTGADMLLRMLFGSHESIGLGVILNPGLTGPAGLCWDTSLLDYSECIITTLESNLELNSIGNVTTLTISGNIVINEDTIDLSNLTPGTITSVGTPLIVHCTDHSHPTCNSISSMFTKKDALNISVSGGQMVQVKVEISFS